MKTINVYSFDELKPEAQKKAIETWRNNHDLPFLSDDLKTEAEELLKKHRIKAENLEVHYSLSYCQGDGLNLTGKFTYKGKTFSVKHTWRYPFPEASEVTLISQSISKLSFMKEATITKREDEFRAVYVQICKDLEKWGYEQIEYQTSDEYITEGIRANEYDFLEDGRIV